MKITNFILIHICFFQLHCGKNVYQSADTPQAAEKAVIALENEKPDKAIEILEAAIKEEPDNYKLISLLATANAQKAEIDVIDITLNLATNSTKQGESESNNPLVSLFTIVPDASRENISLVTTAVSLLDSIPENSRSAADIFRLTMYQTALMTLKTKALDTNQDGTIGLEELNNLSDEQATAILESIVAAELNAQTFSGSGNQEQAVKQISGISEKVKSQPGTTTAEKLKSFLAGS